MPNRNSHVGHLPERTCVICRTKKLKSALLRFVLIDGDIVFDCKQVLNKRGYYVCFEKECILKLEKWLKKKRKKVRR